MRPHPTWLLLSLFACGDNAQSLISTSIEPSGDNCAAGGVRVMSGLDTNGDGELTIDEATTVEYLCNGSDGIIGGSGPDGEEGKPSECNERDPIRVEAIEGMPELLYKDETSAVTVVTNTEHPSTLAVQLAMAPRDLQAIDAGEGVLELTPTQRTVDGQSLTLIVTDGCTQAIRTIYTPEATTLPGWLQLISLDATNSSFYMRLESEIGTTERLPLDRDLQEGDADVRRAIPSGPYFARRVQGSWTQDLGFIELAADDDKFGVVWTNDTTTEMVLIDRPVSTPAPGEAVVRVWQMNETLPLQDVYQDEQLIQSLWVPGSYFETTSGSELVLDFTPLGVTPAPGRSNTMTVPDLVVGETYDVFLFQANGGQNQAVAIPENSFHPIVDGLFEVTPLPLLADTADFTDSAGNMVTADVPYPSPEATDWISHWGGGDIHDPDSTSYRKVTVPGATELLVTVYMNAGGTDTYFQARQTSDGTMLFDASDNLTGTQFKTFYVQGDTVEMAIHAGFRPFGPGYRVESIGYSID